MAESFGSDVERYDRTRPRYPPALVDRIVAESAGTDLLDVGCGTGIEARAFQAAGCTVLGVEPDARMARFAGRSGVNVEVNRPGFAGGSDSTERWSYASAKEVPERAA